MDLNDGDISYERFLMDNLHNTDNLLERCLSTKTCSSLTLTGGVSDAEESTDSFIQADEGFFNETLHNDDENMLEILNAVLKPHDLEHFNNKNSSMGDHASTDSIAISLIDAAVQCTPAERNGSPTSTTPSSSFTNVTEMQSFNDSDDPKDFDDFSVNSFKSDRDMDSTSSDLMSLSDSEGDILSTEGSSIQKKYNAFQKIKKFFGRLLKVTPSCCRCQRLH
ncbi:hypothetical protein TNCT_604681 [Trichonephila clavata]|uniref:Uncharacterized protein n=1 Tax=Trichonephila clavata TaxID=2740835 RepID=A0A8X6F7Q3_TRICU|nr:hypothetical protein TNCT_604681 [Trichonephila clavata]